MLPSSRSTRTAIVPYTPPMTPMEFIQSEAEKYLRNITQQIAFRCLLLDPIEPLGDLSDILSPARPHTRDISLHCPPIKFLSADHYHGSAPIDFTSASWERPRAYRMSPTNFLAELGRREWEASESVVD